MEKVYRIGSFNLHNIGISAFANSRDLEKIANIIKTEKLDVIALQEILTQGKIFTLEDLPSSIAKKNIISYLGGRMNGDLNGRFREMRVKGMKGMLFYGTNADYDCQRLRLFAMDRNLSGLMYLV